MAQNHFEITNNDFAVSSRVFFKPLPAFFDYLERICPNRRIIEIGAGSGWVAHQLSLRNYKVLAVDLYPRDDTYFNVVELDAETMLFSGDALPIICRPCHGGWTERVVDNVMKGLDRMLYVGLVKNIGIDLDNLEGKYRLEIGSDCAGEEGEIMVLINKS